MKTKEKLWRFINNNPALIIFGILAAVTTPLLQPMLGWLAPNGAPVKPSDYILLLTFWALLWYAWLTRGIYNEATTQRELSQRPILMPYLRKLDDYEGDERERMWEKLKDYHIKANDIIYILRVRNEGMAPAFNVRMSFMGDHRLTVASYQNTFLAPTPSGDEQAISIKWLDNRRDQVNIEDLNGVKVTLGCHNINRKYYTYKYQFTKPAEQLIDLVD